MFAGVAQAIANRYAIDPVIVRVALVVTTVFGGGAGVLLYLLGWLFFPEQNDEEAPFMSMVHQGRSSTGTAFTVLLCMALIGVSFWTFNGNGNGLIGLILLVVAMYLLHRNRASLGQQTARQPPLNTTTTARPQDPEPNLGMDMSTPVTDPEPPRTDPPAWDPLGAAPFAWDLPEPTPVNPEPEPPVRRKRARVGGITLGAALVIGGACVLAAPYAAWLSVPHIVGIVLAVIGIGMVGGSFLGGGRGLIGLAVPLALGGFVLTNTGPGGGPAVVGEEWGTINDTPASVQELRSDYTLGGGSVNLDLTALKSTEPVRTNVKVGLGNAVVIVPANAEVDVNCSASRGSVECLGQRDNGIPARVRATQSGTSGLKITLDVRASTGNVEVRRG
ncbi:phage shock protein C (PspC) family protein [Actinocrispum wychmicini]|uniref:Phage shock protein C (PspC) family protein n=2 Tax=Actinocrispum wychmicini TaxID=1213861 RepID=A0A4R2JZM8_9PSEU|nr:phage shock protein C (PspC) family protein [Actinocrispum wychmicini]